MKICPVAIAVGCAKCPVFKVCPLKSTLGDQPAKSDKPVAKAAAAPVKSARNTRAAAPSRGGKAAKPSASRRK